MDARGAAARRRPPERKNDMRLVNRTFEELQPGDSAEIRRLITADDLYVFAATSGNTNPMHLQDSDLDGDGTVERIAPGMFVASLISAVLGTRLPGPGTLYRRQTLDFHARTHAGEELVTRVEVLGKADGAVRLRTEVRRAGDGTLVLSGEAEVLAPVEKFDREEMEVPGLIVQRHRHFEALVERARPLPALPTAVVCPEEANSLGGALLAAKDSIIAPILIGNATAIRKAADEIGAELSGIEIIDVAGDMPAAERACALVHEGRAAAVMKGHLHTDDLLKPMLDKTLGLRAGRRFTHVFVMDVPGQPEPLLVSDAAINIAPDLPTKVDIVQNAIDLARSLGMDPRAGVLSAVETVNPAIQSSIDAALLSKMADRGQITGGLVEGPLAMDNAVDMGAARAKGLKGGVAGRANILIVPGLDAGNMLAKQLTFVSHAEAAGLVLGAKVPVILNSRSDGPMSRLASCAVAALHQAAGAKP
jgi:phosphate butyryltransferase